MHLLICFLLLLCSCSSHLSRCEKQIVSYRRGEEAHVQDEDFPIGSFTDNREAVRLLLDRGFLRLQQGDAKGSLSDFNSALDAIDYYRRLLPQDTAIQLLLDDQQSPYIARSYEILAARFYAAFACYQLGELDNAFALIKQALAQEDLHHEQKGKKRRSALLSYLMAMHLERQQDFSQAELFYQRAYSACQLSFIERDLKRVATREPNRQATILLIVHNGLIPEKMSVVAPASVASAAAVEILLSAWDIPPAISSLSGIALPAFAEERSSPFPAPLRVNGQQYSAEKLEDFFALAKEELEEEIPSLAAQAVARQLIRRATVGVVREKNAIAGDLLDLFALAANLATQADTRMWKTLPQEICFLRLDLPPGTYQMGYGTRKASAIAMQSGELRVLQLFHPSRKQEYLLMK
jgi:hypothetical protein